MTPPEVTQFPMSESDYRTFTQGYVDRVCNYRNLAISLGATPDDMTNAWDRSLCENWAKYQNDPEGWSRDSQRDENREMWEENCVYEDALNEIVSRHPDSVEGEHPAVDLARKALAQAKAIEAKP